MYQTQHIVFQRMQKYEKRCTKRRGKKNIFLERIVPSSKNSENNSRPQVSQYFYQPSNKRSLHHSHYPYLFSLGSRIVQRPIRFYTRLESPFPAVASKQTKHEEKDETCAIFIAITPSWFRGGASNARRHKGSEGREEISQGNA